MGKAAGILDSLSPFKVMSRGFSVITMRGKMINSTHQLKAGDYVTLRLADGTFQLRFCKEAKAVSKNTEKKELSLEQAMARIEQILQILDSGQGTLG